MTLFRLITRGLRHYRRTGLAIVFGVATAAAALTGSLLVGHSVSGSLRETALARLGNVSYAVMAPREFRAQLAGDVKAGRQCSGFSALFLAAGAATNTETHAGVPHVNIIGVDGSFWENSATEKTLEGREALINTALARDLGLEKGDSCLINLVRGGAMSSGNLFAQRSLDATQRTLRVTIAEVLPDRGPGGLTLAAGSAVPRNILLARAWLLEMLHKGDVANTLLAHSPSLRVPDQEKLQARLAAACTLRDYGLSLVPAPQRNCLLLRSDGMVLPHVVVKAGRDAAAAHAATARRTSVYLAERMYRPSSRFNGSRLYQPQPESAIGTSISYVLLAAVERPPGGDVPAKDPVLLNAWAADDLGLRRFSADTSLILEYLVPSLDGRYTTQPLRLRYAGTVPITPADAALVPPIDGVSDADRIDAWQAPFPVDLQRVTDRDEAYWEQYQATPKAYVDLETIRTMWASGPRGEHADWVTALMVTPPAGQTLEGFAKEYDAALLKRLDPADFGLVFRPVRAQALAAATSATDFGQLFIAMSLFLIAAAAGLAGMLMRLMAEGRAAQAGVMLAQGFTPAQVMRALWLEGAILSAAGTLLGVPLGILYAWALIRGLTSWWQGAVGEAALWLHLGAGPLLLGIVAGLLVGLGAVAWGARGLIGRAVPALLGGWQSLAMLPGRRAPIALTSASALALIALILVGLGIGQLLTPAVAFFTGGAALLAGGLCAGAALLARGAALPILPVSLPRLALRNAAANRGRSLLVVGLLASATFVVVTVAANARDFTRLDTGDRAAGTGGFALRAIATAPLPYDLSTPAGRANLGFSAADEASCTGVTVYPFLMSPGDDISCRNLNRPAAPRVIGVPPAMVRRGGFTLRGAEWPALWKTGDPVPAFGDAESVVWSLHSGLARTLPLPLPDGKTAALRVDGLVAASIFGSELLVSEENFTTLFPGITMPRYFLIETPPGRERAVAEALRRNLGELGLEVRDTREVLNGYLRVQNTYLSMFLAIGGLGMLLGTVGLLLALLRNAQERRREFALMLATGFRTEDLSRLLVLENGGLLIAGLLLGTGAALIAVAPRFIAADARIHWPGIVSLLLALLAVGLLSTLAAARAAVRGRLLEALRGE